MSYIKDRQQFTHPLTLWRPTMSETKPHQAAFATRETTTRYGQPGLTKREWFAGLALQGIIAGGNSAEVLVEGLNRAAIDAQDAVVVADALIAALNADTAEGA